MVRNSHAIMSYLTMALARRTAARIMTHGNDIRQAGFDELQKELKEMKATGETSNDMELNSTGRRQQKDPPAEVIPHASRPQLERGNDGGEREKTFIYDVKQNR